MTKGCLSDSQARGRRVLTERRLRGRFFPLRGETGQLVGDGGELAIDGDGPTARFVNGGVFQLDGQLLLLTFEGGDVHFQFLHPLLALAFYFGFGFACFGFGAPLRFLFAQPGGAARGGRFFLLRLGIR